MNEIRKNTEKEIDIIKMSFKIEPVVIVLDLLMALVGIGAAIGGVLLMLYYKPATVLALVIIIFGVVVFLYNILGLILKIAGQKKSEVVVSNRRIYGKYGPYLIKKTFSYRLDEIDNVELGEYLGAHTIVINFQDGKGPRSSPQVQYRNSASFMVGAGVFRIRSIQNYKEVYEKLTEMLLALKSNVDLETDIQMAKVDAENRKADAMEKMAGNMSAGIISSDNVKNGTSTSYIEEIKQLKELLDSGAITQEEFEQEKKEILDNNH